MSVARDRVYGVNRSRGVGHTTSFASAGMPRQEKVRPPATALRLRDALASVVGPVVCAYLPRQRPTKCGYTGEQSTSVPTPYTVHVSAAGRFRARERFDVTAGDTLPFLPLPSLWIDPCGAGGGGGGDASIHPSYVSIFMYVCTYLSTYIRCIHPSTMIE